MRDLNIADRNWAVSRLPTELRQTMEQEPGPIVVAGGFLRSTITGDEVRDIDVFVGDGLRARVLARRVLAAMKLPAEVYATPNAISLRGTHPMIQIITRWTYDCLDACLASFDFTIAQAGLMYNRRCEQWDGRCHPRYYEDLAAKRLIYTSPARDEDSGGSMLRLLTFVSRGYGAPLATTAQVVGRVLGSEPDPIERLLVRVDPPGETGELERL